MKMKTSVTLSEDILKRIKRVSRKGESRSEAIERLLDRAFEYEMRRASDQRDLDLINRNAEQLNREAGDVLEYQEDED
jgi:metal-responsive CopG/Arc/MetJ family transcriptional regulator